MFKKKLEQELPWSPIPNIAVSALAKFEYISILRKLVEPVQRKPTINISILEEYELLNMICYIYF